MKIRVLVHDIENDGTRYSFIENHFYSLEMFDAERLVAGMVKEGRIREINMAHTKLTAQLNFAALKLYNVTFEVIDETGNDTAHKG